MFDLANNENLYLNLFSNIYIYNIKNNNVYANFCQNPYR